MSEFLWVVAAYAFGCGTGAYVHHCFKSPDLLVANAEARNAQFELLRVRAELRAMENPNGR